MAKDLKYDPEKDLKDNLTVIKKEAFKFYQNHPQNQHHQIEE